LALIPIEKLLTVVQDVVRLTAVQQIIGYVMGIFVRKPAVLIQLFLGLVHPALSLADHPLIGVEGLGEPLLEGAIVKKQEVYHLHFRIPKMLPPLLEPFLDLPLDLVLPLLELHVVCVIDVGVAELTALLVQGLVHLHEDLCLEFNLLHHVLLLADVMPLVGPEQRALSADSLLVLNADKLEGAPMLLASPNQIWFSRHHFLLRRGGRRWLELDLPLDLPLLWRGRVGALPPHFLRAALPLIVQEPSERWPPLLLHQLTILIFEHDHTLLCFLSPLHYLEQCRILGELVGVLDGALDTIKFKIE
jgi:hypothetical protein